MKNIILLFAVFTLFVSGCGTGINPEKIFGSWRIVEFQVDAPLLTDEMIEESKRKALTEVFTFNEDKTCSISIYNTTSIEYGTYDIDLETNQLEMVIDNLGDGFEVNYQLLLLNDNSLRWRLDLSEMGSCITVLERVE